jgi:hypothetical protein
MSSVANLIGPIDEVCQQLHYMPAKFTLILWVRIKSESSPEEVQNCTNPQHSDRLQNSQSQQFHAHSVPDSQEDSQMTDVIPLHDTQQSLDEQMQVKNYLRDTQSLNDFDPDAYNTDANHSPPRPTTVFKSASYTRTASIASIARTSSVASGTMTSPIHPRVHARGGTFDDVMDSQQSVRRLKIM